MTLALARSARLSVFSHAGAKSLEFKFPVTQRGAVCEVERSHAAVLQFTRREKRK